MRLLLCLLFLMGFSNITKAEILIMVCKDVTGKRVEFMYDSKKFKEGADGYGNAKHVFVFDTSSPKVIKAKWQAYIPDSLNTKDGRKRVDEIVGLKFESEVIVRRDGNKFTTFSGTGPSVYMTMYDFDEGILLTTRITGNGIIDVAAYYKGRCERIS